MNTRFRELVPNLEGKLKALLAMPPVTVDTVPPDAPVGGVYLFSTALPPNGSRA